MTPRLWLRYDTVAQVVLEKRKIALANAIMSRYACVKPTWCINLVAISALREDWIYVYFIMLRLFIILELFQLFHFKIVPYSLPA
jgi:hypothetical protein